MLDIRGRGIVVRQRNNLTLTAPIKEYHASKHLSIPISIGAKVQFAIGSKVMRNDLLSVDEENGIRVFSPCDGLLDSIVTTEHPTLGNCDLLNITVTSTPQIEENAQLTLGDMTVTYQNIAGILDTLDGKSLAHKLKEFSENGISILAADAIQDQPFVCNETGVLHHHYQLVEEGLKIAAHLCGIKKTEIFVYYRRDYSEPELKFDSRITVVCGKYPARYLFIKKNKKKIGLISAQACVDLVKLARTGEQQLTTVVTISGQHITKPCNVRAPIGTHIGELIDFCIPDDSPAAVVIGGPMNGKYIENLNTPIYPGMSAILLMEPIAIRDMTNCWGCGECVRCCPKELMPLYIARFSRHNKWSDCKDFGATRCIECGCCSFVCTGGMDPMSYILNAKNQLQSYRSIHQKQDLPQRRHPLSTDPSALPKLEEGGNSK